MQKSGPQYDRDNLTDNTGFLMNARLHQSQYRAFKLNVPHDRYGNYLTKEDASKGMNFYDDFGGVSVRILEDFYRTWFSIRFYEDFYTRAIGIQRGSKGFLYGFYMDVYVESLRNQKESRGFLKGFYRSFYKDVMGISVRILLSSNEITFI